MASSTSPALTAEQTQSQPSVPGTEENKQEKEQTPVSTTPAPHQPTPENKDDDESDFDELDDVLDDFKPKPAAGATTTTTTTTSSSSSLPPVAAGSADEMDEIAFMSQLEKDMANMMSQAAQQSGRADNEGFENGIHQGADAFTKQLEESGIPPGDFLKQLLADVMAEEAAANGGDSGAAATTSTESESESTSTPKSAAGAGAGAPPPDSFNDAIQRTINRMKESGDKATAAAEEDNADDLIAQLLKALEAGTDGAAGDDEGDLTKMFMGMMEQLSNKDMLYEPMKELDTKFGPWIQENKGKGNVSEADMARYEAQAILVRQIVAKFEEKGYTDEDAKCREYVWEKMQAMQAAGNPPDELVANPWMDDLNKGGVPDCPQQ